MPAGAVLSLWVGRAVVGRAAAAASHVTAVLAHTAPLHAPETGPSTALTLLLLIGGLGASAVIALALVALLHRRSRPYLLVTLAIGAILVRTLVAAVSLQGMVGGQVHHLAEHALDVVMVALVIAAVYTAREPPE